MVEKAWGKGLFYVYSEKREGMIDCENGGDDSVDPTPHDCKW